jgi:hypothetical protein
MIHIKLFEGFSTEDYYIEVPKNPSGSYITAPSSNVLDCREDIVKLKPYLSKGVSIKREEDMSDSSYEIDRKSPAYYNMILLRDNKFTDKSFTIYIKKLIDEWYEVFFYDYASKEAKVVLLQPDFVCTQYKCDQWEGLLKLLKDKGLTK